MKIPDNLDEEYVINTISKIAKKLAPRYTFACYEVEDIEQEAFLIGLSGLENEAWIVVTDGNEKELFKKVIKYTDCPDGDWNFFFTGSVLMLPSEY